MYNDVLVVCSLFIHSCTSYTALLLLTRTAVGEETSELGPETDPESCTRAVVWEKQKQGVGGWGGWPGNEAIPYYRCQPH